MVDVVRIEIFGESGYVTADEEYTDALIITDHSIEYECKPYEPSDVNPIQKWSYRSNSPAFKRLFSLTITAIQEIFRRDPQCPGTDMPVTTFVLTHSDNKTTKNMYMVNPNEFRECFSILKKMVPPCELVPWVLQTSDDYRKKGLWHRILSR